MRVVKADVDDVESAYTIIDACRLALESQGLMQWDASYPDRGFLRKAALTGNLFTLLDEKALCGMVILDANQAPEWSSVAWLNRVEPSLVIHALAVSPAIQQHGLGKFMLAFCEGESHRRGCKSVRLDAFSENTDVLKFYERYGYVLCGEVYFASKPAGHRRYFCYEKMLGR